MADLTIRNLIYSSLGLALAASYLYVHTQPAPSKNSPLVASDEHVAAKQTEKGSQSAVTVKHTHAAISAKSD